MAIWPKKWLRLGQNSHFCIFVYLFPQNEAEIDSEWSISPDSQLFPSFATKASHFWRNLKNFHFWGGVHWQIFMSFPTFSNCFTPIWLKMTHNGKFGPKSGLDWVKTAIFAYFSIFSPKMRLRLTQNGQFHLIHNFSLLLPPKHLIFGEISKIFISGEGGTSAIFLEFSNFYKSFHTNEAGDDPQWQIWPKKWLRLGQNGHFCIFFYLFPQNEAEIDSEWSISPDSQLFPSFATKASHFWRNLKNFLFWGGGDTSAIFLEFSNFYKSFHTNAAGNDPQWQIWPKKWLRLGQNGHFCIFFYLFPQNEAEIDLEWSISPDSQLFPSFATKASYFWRNLKNFHFWGGGTSANVLSFPTFSNHFTPMWLEMTHNGKFGPKSGLDWVKMAIFAYLSIFSPKMRLRLTRNGQFHLIHNFSHLLPPKHLIFGEISKISISGGGGYIGKFF